MTRLDQIMALTSAIEDRVNAGDWAGATGLDVERRQLLGDLFASEPAATRDGVARTILEQLRARNDSTMTALNDARQALSITARKLQAAPAIMRAYEHNIIQTRSHIAAETAGE